MKKLLLIFLIIKSLTTFSQSQLEVGFEMGYHITGYIPVQQSIYSEGLKDLGTKIGFFAEREVTNYLNIRSNIFYNHRHFNPEKGAHLRWIPFFNLHTLSFPIKAIFKAGKIVHFGIGPDPLLLIGSTTSNGKTQFHMGICGDITFRIRKLMRLSFYCNYDFATVEYINFPKSNNIAFGISFAIAFKKFKKRRVIYSPG